MTLLSLILAWPAAVAGEGRPIRFDRISTREGLSQATVTCLLQDRIGFIWMCTQDGLNRFDGYDFTVYRNDPSDPESLANNWIMALVEDPSGDLWIGTRGGGLSRWRRQLDTFRSYSHDPEDPGSLSGDQVRALVPARDGGLWVGTDQSGLDFFDPQTESFRHYRHQPADPVSLPDDKIRALLEDRRGRLWVGTAEDGLARLDSVAGDGTSSAEGDPHFTRFRHLPAASGSLSSDEVRSVFEDRTGAIWVGTAGGLDRFDETTGTFQHFRHDPGDSTSLSDDKIRGIFEDDRSRLWVGTDTGLNVLGPDRSGSELTFDRYFHDPTDAGSLPTDRVLTFLQDRGGVLWIGTQSGGVVRWDPRSWSFSSVPIRNSDLSGHDILAFAEDDRGRLWIGTNGYGLNRIDRRLPSAAPPPAGRLTRPVHFRHDPRDPSSLGGDHVTALLIDQRGALWIGTLTAGLSLLEDGSTPGSAGTFRHFRHEPTDPASLSGNIVSALLEDRNAQIWIGTLQGLNRLERSPAAGESVSFTRFRHDPADSSTLSDDRIIAMAEDQQGFFWIGTLGGGLNRFQPRSGAVQRFHHQPGRPDSLSSDGLMSVHVDPGGTVWAGTQAGLNRLVRLDPSTGEAEFRRYLTQDGLPNEFIYGIQSDGGGGLWLSTNKGLSRFDPRAGNFRNYDTSHGLQADEFNFGAHYRSSTGELFFGGINGFNAFHPDRIQLNDRPPPVVPTAVSILNRPAPLDRPVFDLDALELSHRDSIVAFAFAALDYTAPERNRYRYRLEGFNDDWIALGNRRLVTFTNLDAGRYVLRVQGSNNDGVWNEEGLAIRIAMAPPPWQTWWAYAGYALALAATVFAFVLSQHRKVEREREVNRRLKEVDELRGELLANLQKVIAERTAQIAEHERLLAELETKNAELERFNYTVSHDLKSPLVTIKGFLGLLKHDASQGKSDSVHHDIERISAAADRMHQLLDELLNLSRMTQEATEPTPVPLGEVANDALEAVTGAISQRGVTVEITDDLPVVMGDRLRLRELFQNLLANAVKYMGDQPAPKVKIGMQWRGEETIFYVRDNGIGIDPRYHEKIFGLFERLEASEEGTGIGLSLVKRIVEQHGGRVWVESEGKGHGSTFCFTLRQDAEDRGGGGRPASSMISNYDRHRL